ncbi:MAG TPA: GNAT family N-acetyltransferase [Acidimicrobiales bacterium]|nr:GNAT family N-acetyltransferase [Acidimicrobiales bacterium]
MRRHGHGRTSSSNFGTARSSRPVGRVVARGGSAPGRRGGRPRCARVGVVTTVRAATVADAEAVIGLWAAAAGPTRLPSDAGAVARLLERDPGALMIVEADGAVVGTVILGWDGWRAHLYRMAVRPDHRREGVGRLLLDAAAARARAVGARRLDALVHDGNELGAVFWARLGFVRDGEDRRWTRPL